MPMGRDGVSGQGRYSFQNLVDVDRYADAFGRPGKTEQVLDDFANPLYLLYRYVQSRDCSV